MVWECAVDSSGSGWDPVRTVHRDRFILKFTGRASNHFMTKDHTRYCSLDSGPDVGNNNEWHAHLLPELLCTL